MMLYRSLVLGLVGALVMLEVARTSPARAPRPPLDARTAPTIVDVSRRALASTSVDVAPVVGLRPGERIAAIDDEPIRDGGDAIAAIRDALPGEYLDLDVLRTGGARRVLVLVH